MNNIDFVNEIFGEYGILIRSDGNVYLTCNDVFSGVYLMLKLYPQMK